MGEGPGIFLYRTKRFRIVGDDPYSILSALDALHKDGAPVPLPKSMRHFDHLSTITFPMNRTDDVLIVNPTDDVYFTLDTADYVGFRKAVPELRKLQYGPLYPLVFGGLDVLLLPERVVRGLETLNWAGQEVAGLCSSVIKFNPPAKDVQTHISAHHWDAAFKYQ